MSTLVLRFSSLGDVLLCAGVTGALGSVVFGTSARYAPLVARFPGVRAVVGLEPGEGVWAYTRRLPPVEAVVDLHGSARSRAVCALLPGAVRRVRRERARRWARVALKLEVPAAPVVQRYAEAAGVPVAPLPWLDRARTPGAQALGVAPGAAHATKRWGAAAWRALLERWEGPRVLFGSAAERPELDVLAEGLGGAVEVVAEDGFDRTLAALGRCGRFVGSDSGLTHLARISGVPTLVLFGPTTAQDGFWPEVQEVSVELPCRPCSAYGGPRCPLGDHLCMRALVPERVLEALCALPEAP